ncbi:hypothetical protein NFI00_000165 [Salmonella enterica]|nr:hypothetical protein [Salmonella enterica]
MKNDAVALSTLNMVIYLNLGECQIKKNTLYPLGGHGYTYDVAVEGKRKLSKDAPTTSGYFTGNPHKPSTVVDIIDIVSLTVPNSGSDVEALLKGMMELLTYFGQHDEYKNLCVVTRHKEIAQLTTFRDKVKESSYKIGRRELSPEEITLFEQYITMLKEWEAKDHKIIFDLDGSVEGGRGNKAADQQKGLAEVITVWSTESHPTLNLTGRKEYENPESDFNKLVSATRWYFITGEDTDFYEPYGEYRAYNFGKVEPDKKYYGKLTPDVTYSKLYTKKPINLLDKLFEFTNKTVKNPDGLMSAGNLTNIKSKDLVRLIDTYPAVKDKDNLIMPYTVGGQEEPLLVELINPPMLSYRIKESFSNIDIVFNAFINRNSDNEHKNTKFYDITDEIYTKEVNKKGDTKLKIAPTFGMNTSVIKVKVTHRNAVKPVLLILGVGYDLPERNAFNSVTDPDVKVWCAVDTQNNNGIRYCTVTEADDFIYIHTSGIANLRVLSLDELGRKA